MFLIAVLALAAFQESALPFDTPQIQLPVDSPPFQCLLDFDGDGDLDALGARPRRPTSNEVNGFELALWRNDGRGLFLELLREEREFSTRRYSRATLPVAAGDWSGDGLSDFVVAAGRELHRYRSTPGGAQPYEHTLVTSAENIQDLALADFDGDGISDLAMLVGNEANYTGEPADSWVRVLWSGRGVRTSGPSQVALEWRSRLLVGEGDGDALPDLVATHGTLASVVTLERRELLRGPELAFSNYYALLAFGDIDGDGDDDLVSFGPNARVEVARRSGARSWTLEATYSGGPAEYLADLDGDGDLDGVCCSGGGGSSSYPDLRFHSTFEIALNDEGVFRRAFEMPGLGSRSMAGAADVDGDGDVDLVAGRCVFFQSAPWGSLTRPRAGITTQEELCDIDGDGDLEPWKPEETTPALELRAFRNQGDGTFDWELTQLEGPGPGLVATGVRLPGDFDGDGDIDLIRGVVPSATPWALPHYFGLWANRGGGDFAYAGTCLLPDPSAPYPLPSGALTNFLLADLEQDGDLDFVYVPHRFRSQTYLNDGAGHFARDTEFVDPNEGASAFADLDGDGRLDKLVYDGGSPIYMRRGLPSDSPTFFGEYEPLFFGPTGTPGTYSLADFDADGALDLGQVMRDGARLWLNRLATGQSFLETVVFVESFTTDVPYLTAFDGDLDGRLDLLVGPTDTSERSYRFYRQRAEAGPDLGPQAFEAPLLLVLPGVERSTNFSGSYVVETRLLAGDLDGDGDADLLGDYAVRNRAFESAAAGARREYGTATPGTGGFSPKLGARGPFRVGETLEFRLTGASASTALLGLSFAPDERVELGVRVWIATSPAAGFSLHALATQGSGTAGAHARFTLPAASAWIGRALHAQAFVPDPAGPAGWAATRGLQLSIGGS